MKLYNTLTRSVDNFEPQDPAKTTVYTCGPTVYDYPHIGNWFTYIREDILIRTLTALELRPEWVMNITDVGHLVSDADEGEDKLEKGARREGKTAWEVAAYYTDYFVHGMQRLNMLTPTRLVKATDHIAEQTALIQRLEEKGYTYAISDGVYYDISKFPRYADFARLDLAEQQEGARVEANPKKRNPTDFALWKFSRTDSTGHKRDMEWQSPFIGPDGSGTGFPGWHIECSAMAMKYLGETLDIHAGGIDHIPVHHTNEIAQSEAATGKQFARFWFHVNHIMINGDKIAKSAGNGITLEDIEKAGFSLEALRLLVLESHYRTQSHFSWETLEAAQNRLKAYQAMAAVRWQSFGSAEGVSEADLTSYKTAIQAALENDLNTPMALTELSRMAEEISTIGVMDTSQETFADLLLWIDAVLGLQLSAQADITADQKQLIVDREIARQARDWARSDELRATLTEQGIAVRDTPVGTIWRRL
ncbi:MAG TPA: cysteine--tRNA ligase [Candidatus Saccharimonadales bacterium]|nr:cysteine--tRNA ligase [Candidatus Saccharimonadales bacterium]